MHSPSACSPNQAQRSPRRSTATSSTVIPSRRSTSSAILLHVQLLSRLRHRYWTQRCSSCAPTTRPLLANSAEVKTKSESPPHSGTEQPLNRKDRKSTRLNSSHVAISYAVFCLKKKK